MQENPIRRLYEQEAETDTHIRRMLQEECILNVRTVWFQQVLSESGGLVDIQRSSEIVSAKNGCAQQATKINTDTSQLQNLPLRL